MENQNIKNIVSTIISYLNPVKYYNYIIEYFNNKKENTENSTDKTKQLIQTLSTTLSENIDYELIQNISDVINNILAQKRDVNNFTFNSIISAAGYYDTTENKTITCNGNYLSAVNPSGQGGFSIDIIDIGSGNCFHDVGPKIYPSYISKNIVIGNNNWMYPQNFTSDYTEKNIIIGDDNSVGWEGVNEYLVVGNHNRLKDTQSSLVPGKFIIGNYHFIDSTLTSAQIIAGNYSNPWVKLNDLGLTSDVQEIIGAGTSYKDTKNIFIRDWAGNTWQSGNLTVKNINTNIVSANGFYDITQSKFLSGNYLYDINPSGQGTLTIDNINFGINNKFTPYIDTQQNVSSYIEHSIILGSNNNLVQNGSIAGTFLSKNNIVLGDNNRTGDGEINTYLVIGSNNELNTDNSSMSGRLVIGDYHYVGVNCTNTVQVVAGKYSDYNINTQDFGITDELQEIIGGGTSDNDRKNIFIRDWSGNTWQAGNVKSNQQYLNTRICNGTNEYNSYVASYKYGNIHTLTVNSETRLTIEDLPIGCELKIRIVVNNDVNIIFNENTIISEAGIYYITFINIIGTIEILGQPIKIQNIQLDKKKALTFISKINNSSVKLIKNGNPFQEIDLWYCKNNDNWIKYDINTEIILNQNDKVAFWNKKEIFSTNSSHFYQFVTNGELNVQGNIMSLLSFSKTLTAQEQFISLFNNCTGIYSAKNLILPATKLTLFCYQEMFNNCSNLIDAPKLPATILANNCYNSMFNGCINLLNAPELPATILKEGCYAAMFKNCKKLITAPELPAYNLEIDCYNFMFAECSSLNTITVGFEYWPQNFTLFNWVQNISSTGTFICSEELSNKRGPSYIPDGWNILRK